jgi:hypothetical protein
MVTYFNRKLRNYQVRTRISGEMLLSQISCSTFPPLIKDSRNYILIDGLFLCVYSNTKQYRCFWKSSQTLAQSKRLLSFLTRNKFMHNTCIYDDCLHTEFYITYLLMYGAQPFLRSCQLCSHSGNSQQF